MSDKPTSPKAPQGSMLADALTVLGSKTPTLASWGGKAPEVLPATLAVPVAVRPADAPQTAGHELVEKLLVKLLNQMGIQRAEDTAKEWIAECQK